MCASSQLVFLNDRVLVPKLMRDEIVQQSHKAHGGVFKCLSFVHARYFWPHMAQAVRQAVARCQVCMEFAPSRSKEPEFCPETMVLRVLKQVHVDLYSIRQAKFLYIINEFSLYPWYYCWDKDPDTPKFVEQLRNIFLKVGFLEKLRMDGGAQMDSTALRKFCRDNGIGLEYSSPYHSLNNGSMESSLGRLKKLMHQVWAALGAGQDF